MYAILLWSGVGPFELLVIMLFLVIGVAGTIFWVWMLIDCATKEPSEGNDKIIWILVIALAHWVGALIYLIVRRPVRMRQFGR